jgi:hypothetical protein
MNQEPAPTRAGFGGLCPDCAHGRVVVSARGATFQLCRLSARDARYARYPRLPVLACAGFRAAAGGESGAPLPPPETEA